MICNHSINTLIHVMIMSTNMKTTVEKLLLIPLPKYCNKTIKAMRGYCTCFIFISKNRQSNLLKKLGTTLSKRFTIIEIRCKVMLVFINTV